MRLAKFLHRNKIYWGAVSKDGTYLKTSFTDTENMTHFEDVVTYFEKPNVEEKLNIKIDLFSVQLLPPVIPTKNVLCIGKNYYDHILEFDGNSEDVERVKENPIFFSKAITSIVGPGHAIESHTSVTHMVDYEAELAVIIGEKCLNIEEKDAYKYIFAYTALNDVTARDLQTKHQQWLKGKSLDTFCPIGPWLVTKDSCQNPQNLKIQSFVNGELRQDGVTSQMMHNIPSLVATLSKGMTLYPGDIIATGTPKGVGKGFNPPKYLKPGDQVEVRIETIGSLINKVL